MATISGGETDNDKENTSRGTSPRLGNSEKPLSSESQHGQAQPLVPKVARRLGQPTFGASPRGVDTGAAPVIEGTSSAWCK